MNLVIPPDLTGKVILVVDDDDDLRDLIVREFRGVGASVLEAPSGNEALAIAKVRPIDGVISDVRMANGSGIDLLIALRNIHASKPVVVLLSGFADLEEYQVHDLGGASLLSKPISRQNLLTAFKGLI